MCAKSAWLSAMGVGLRCDMLAPMNYRRGFQRLYAVLAIAWVAGLLFTLPSDRLRFWAALSPAQFDPDAFMAAQARDKPPPPPGAQPIPPLPPGFKLDAPAVDYAALADKARKQNPGPWDKYAAPPIPTLDQFKAQESAGTSDYVLLGQKIKSEYPGAYDDLSDFDLGTRVKAKYPNLDVPSNLSRDWFARNAPPMTKLDIDAAVNVQSRTQKALWLSGVLLLPPSFG